MQDKTQPRLKVLNIIQAVDRYCLFKGYQEYFRGLICRDDIVLSHCDTQENNILAAYENSTQLTLIDYEYADWNPMQFDIANYLNETMIDNAHPKDFGIAYYPDNMPSDGERLEFLSKYLALYYDKFVKSSSSDYKAGLEEALPRFDL